MTLVTYRNLSLFGPIILAGIILIIFIRFKIGHPFWDKQPVMRDSTENKMGIIGKTPILNIKLKKGYKIIINNYSLSKIKIFLDNHFSTTYNLDEDYLNYMLNKEGSHNIVLLKDHEIIGFIYSDIIDLMISNKLVRFRCVDYLCIHPSYRNNYMATLLISAIIKRNDTKTPMIFKKDYSKLPYCPVLSTAYFIKDIRTLTPGKTESIRKLTPFNFYTYFKYTNALLKRFSIYKPYSKSEFFEIFLNKCIMDYIIIENKNSLKTIIIGKKTIYKQDKIILNCFEIDLIIGELRYTKDIDMLLSSHLKNIGYNYICIPAIGSNIKFIKDNNYKLNNKVYYYTYNYNIPNAKLDEFALNIN